MGLAHVVRSLLAGRLLDRFRAVHLYDPHFRVTPRRPSMLVDVNRIPALKILEAKHFPDERGELVQSWVRADLEALGIPSDFKQAIQTVSRRGVLRGLHFQWDPPMGKYVRCLRGAILDVVVDVRQGSPRLGDHVAVELTGRNHRIIWVPPGFAHATFALEDETIVLY